GAPAKRGRPAISVRHGAAAPRIAFLSGGNRLFWRWHCRDAMPPEGVLDSAKQPSRTHVRMREFSKSLPMSLLRAREAVMLRFRSSLRMFNITEQQWRILRALTSIREIE